VFAAGGAVMVRIITRLLRLSGWSAMRLSFRPIAVDWNEVSTPRPRHRTDPGLASFSDVALASIGERSAWLCLALLMAAKVAACHGWLRVRLGLDPPWPHEAQRGPPLSW